MPRSPLPVGTWGSISRAQSGPGRWVARARFRDADGRTRKVEAWGSTGAKAENALKKAMVERAAVIASEIKPDTRLAEVGRRWLEERVDGSDLATNTRQRYRDVVEKYVTPGVGGLTVREATTPRTESYLKQVTAASGPATAKLCRTVLTGMLALATVHGATPANPMRETSVIASHTPEVRALTVPEVRSLRAALRADKVAVRGDLPLLVDLLLATGCRIGEVLALRWADVDLKAGTVTVSGTIVRVKGVGLERQDKTKGKKARVLTLPAWAVKELKAAKQKAERGVEPVIPSWEGSWREVATVESQWRRWRERHEAWSWVTPHTFRKTVATAVERQRGSRAAASQLGHSSEAVTNRHYIEQNLMAEDVSDVLAAFAT